VTQLTANRDFQRMKKSIRFSKLNLRKKSGADQAAGVAAWLNAKTPHSYRNATDGSTCVARLAGTNDATSATTRNNAEMLP